MEVPSAVDPWVFRVVAAHPNFSENWAHKSPPVTSVTANLRSRTANTLPSSRRPSYYHPPKRGPTSSNSYLVQCKRRGALSCDTLSPTAPPTLRFSQPTPPSVGGAARTEDHMRSQDLLIRVFFHPDLKSTYCFYAHMHEIIKLNRSKSACRIHWV